jgi:hypothetical protein
MNSPTAGPHSPKRSGRMRARGSSALEKAETPEALEGLGWSAWWLDPLEESADHGWLAFHEGYAASTRGEAAEASRLGAGAAE